MRLNCSKTTKIITYENSELLKSEIEDIGYPNPIKTTEVLSNELVKLFVLPSNGLPRIKVKTIPVIRANQDEIFNSGMNKERGIVIIHPKKRNLLNKLLLILIIN